MKTVMVRYKTKPEKANENAAYIERVFAELAQSNLAGVRYAVFRLADGVSFVHIASIETADGNNPLLQTAAFKAFQSGIKERCDEPPVAAELTPIGSHRFFG